MAYDEEYYSISSEKKWKILKKDEYCMEYYSKSYNNSNSIDPSLIRSVSQKHASKSSSPPTSFQRSFSQKPATSSSSLYRSLSIKNSSSYPSSHDHRNPSSKDHPHKSNLIRSFSNKSSAFGKKCSHLAKDQKARFYIIKRCVSMLVSWRKNPDS